MCLIIHKDSKTEYDHISVSRWIKNSSIKNSMGYGFAIKNKDDILVRKGFETSTDLIKSLAWYYKNHNFDDKEIVIHLRAASFQTANGLETTHPIIGKKEENSKSKVYTVNPVLVHNGYLSHMRTAVNSNPDETSDTLMFAEKYLKTINDFYFMNYMRRNHTELKFDTFYGLWSNKIIVLKSGSPTIFYGKLIESKSHKGYLFSNDSYRDSFPQEWVEKNKKTYFPTHETQSQYNARKNNVINSDSASNNHNPSFSGGNFQKARNSNPGIYDAYSHLVQIAHNDPFSVRFFYTSISLLASNKYKYKHIVNGINPLSCYNNKIFKNDNCCVNVEKAGICCKAVEEAGNFEQMDLRSTIYNFIQNKSYLKLKGNDRVHIGYATIDVLEAISKSEEKTINWFWTSCTCKANEIVSKKEREKTCSSCQGIGLELGTYINLKNLNSDATQKRRIDYILVDYQIQGHEWTESVPMSTVINSVIDYAKLLILRKKNASKNTMKSHPDVSGE